MCSLSGPDLAELSEHKSFLILSYFKLILKYLNSSSYPASSVLYVVSVRNGDELSVFSDRGEDRGFIGIFLQLIRTLEFINT